MTVPESKGSSSVLKAGEVCDRTMVCCGLAQEIGPSEKRVVGAAPDIVGHRSSCRYVAQWCGRRTLDTRWRIKLSCLENNVDFCVFLALLDSKINLGDRFSKCSPHRTKLGAISVCGLRSCHFQTLILTRLLLVLRGRGEGNYTQAHDRAKAYSKQGCAFDQPRGASGWGPGFPRLREAGFF